MKLVLTCEHAFNTISNEYTALFSDAEDILNSHRAYDPGALDLFRELEVLADFSQFQEIGRLLVEVNRSIGHPSLFSEFTINLSQPQKAEVLKQYYFPYRNAVENKILALMEKGEKLLHLSVHTFTPELNGLVRNADIGILYDPAKPEEKEFSKKFKSHLNNHNPELIVRFNYPYLGSADGFTTYLRKKFPENYMGIELEVNQNFVSENQMDYSIKNSVFMALKGSLK